MHVDHEDIQTLTELGLTGSQARVYLALVKLGKADARTLWKASKVSRQDIYRVLTELREFGLVEKIIEAPTEFKAAQIEDGVAILIKRKTRQVLGLQRSGDKLIQKFKKKDLRTPLEKEETQYVLIPEKEALTLRLKRAIESTQESIDVITSMRAFVKALFAFSKEVKRALRKGVEIRWIIDKPEDVDSWPEVAQAFAKNPNFKLRFIPNPRQVRLGIYDKKEVFLAFFPKRDALESPALWSTNMSFVEIVQSFFETVWNTAVEYKLEER